MLGAVGALLPLSQGRHVRNHQSAGDSQPPEGDGALFERSSRGSGYLPAYSEKRFGRDQDRNRYDFRLCSDRAPEGRSRRPHLLSRRAARDRQAGRKRHARMVSADPAEAHRGAQSRRFQVYAQQGEKGAPAGLYVRHRRAD